jgi:hypothetical protein
MRKKSTARERLRPLGDPSGRRRRRGTVGWNDATTATAATITAATNAPWKPVTSASARADPLASASSVRCSDGDRDEREAQAQSDEQEAGQEVADVRSADRDLCEVREPSGDGNASAKYATPTPSSRPSTPPTRLGDQVAFAQFRSANGRSPRVPRTCCNTCSRSRVWTQSPPAAT